MEEGRAYFILNQVSGLFLDLSRADETSVLIYEPHGGDNQKWIATRKDDGLWTLNNVAYGKFLSTAGEPEPGVKVIAAHSPTLWEVREEVPGFFSIRIPDSSLVVTLPNNGSVPSGTPVELQDGQNPLWMFKMA